jgi:ketosteroid isomerase-like protein
MRSQETVLFANEAFYNAFARSDFPAMDALWARDTHVICIHPGWHALTTREQIMESWRQMFEAGTTPVTCRSPEVFITGDVAFVVCYEQLADAVLVATNAFRRHDDAWHMVHHQAGPTRIRPSPVAAADGGKTRIN